MRHNARHWRPLTWRAMNARWAAALGLAVTMAATAADARPPFGPYPIDRQLVLDAIAAAQAVDLGGAVVTGLTLPHHRVATDLIATGMVTAARGARPERIVLLLPDHFRRSMRAFATTRRDFDTVLGRVPTDRAAAETLLRSPEVAESVLFEREHALGELLPYLARLFPGVPILPLAVRIGSSRAQWERMVTVLAPWITSRTLIIQSTDFSHYLSRELAARRDQQMLNVIAAGDLDALARAEQPAHIDSRGSQYLQMRLQALRFGATPIVYGNANSADSGATVADNTTSYVAQLYAPATRDRVVWATPPARTLCVAGDTFFGRHVAARLTDAGVRQRLREALRARLRGCPLLVNLEGVLTDDVAPAHTMQLLMPVEATIGWLRELGVVAVSLANNHTRDLGDAGYARMAQRLHAAGLQVLNPGEPQNVGPLRVVALTDLDNHPGPRHALVELSALHAARWAPQVPDLALLHWGREYAAAPGARERAIARQLRLTGVPLVVGAHPHRASRGIQLLGGLDGVWVYSLGNFVFDQHGPRVSGAVLQITVFSQGTRALRLIPWPDLYDLVPAAPTAGR